VLTGRWLADILIDTAPRLRIRKRETLRLHHPGKTDEEIAESLIGTAARAAAAVGVAGGALAAAEFAAPPTLVSMPAQIATETLVIAAIEVKLIAELHEAYGAGTLSSGSPMLAYTSAWANRRGIDPLNPGILTAGLGAAAKQQIQRRLLGRAGRNLTTLGPFLAGAVAGSVVNHQGTRRLGAQIREELRASRRPAG
jgi:hypothetical protein